MLTTLAVVALSLFFGLLYRICNDRTLFERKLISKHLHFEAVGFNKEEPSQVIYDQAFSDEDQLNIVSTVDQEISLKILDMQGKTIKQFNNFSDKTLDLSALHPGQYILSVRNEKESHNQMLIKL